MIVQTHGDESRRGSCDTELPWRPHKTACAHHGNRPGEVNLAEMAAAAAAAELVLASGRLDGRITARTHI